MWEELVVEPAAAATFESIYQREWAPLVRLAWLMTGSRETAEDIVQDAFIGLNHRHGTVRDPGGYLYRSVVNGVRGCARRRAVAARHAPSPAAPVFIPEVDEMWRLLDHLPERQRHALVLRYYEDLDLHEISQLLDCRLGTVKSLIHRGLAKLQDLMGP